MKQMSNGGMPGWECLVGGMPGWVECRMGGMQDGRNARMGGGYGNRSMKKQKSNKKKKGFADL